MIPAWRDSFPQRFDRPGYQGEAADNRLRTKTSTGPGKSRRRSRAMPEPLSGKMTLRRAVLLDFVEFLADDIKGGATPFLFPDPMEGLPILVRIGDVMPKWTPIAGDFWSLALSLEKLFTGDFEPGLPDLPAGYAYLTNGGAYVLADRVPVIVQVSP